MFAKVVRSRLVRPVGRGSVPYPIHIYGNNLWAEVGASRLELLRGSSCDVRASMPFSETFTLILEVESFV